jgi:hypothetical protein
MSDKSEMKLSVNNQPELSDEEIEALLTFKATSGTEVIKQGLTGLWVDRGIEESVEWLKQHRN